MAANVESMFWTGRTAPWHGLGIGVENAPDSKEALEFIRNANRFDHETMQYIK